MFTILSLECSLTINKQQYIRHVLLIFQVLVLINICIITIINQGWFYIDLSMLLMEGSGNTESGNTGGDGMGGNPGGGSSNESGGSPGGGSSNESVGSPGGGSSHEPGGNSEGEDEGFGEGENNCPSCREGVGCDHNGTTYDVDPNKNSESDTTLCCKCGINRPDLACDNCECALHKDCHNRN